MSLPADAHLYPPGTEWPDGIRTGYGQTLTKTVVRLPDAQEAPMTSLHAPLFTTQEEIAMAAMPATPKPAKPAKPAKKRPSWKELPDEELAAHLLAHKTLADSTWAERAGRSRRRKGESRSDFIRRCLLR